MEQRPRLRPIALPTEHGGWALVGAPIILGLGWAFSLGGLLLGLSALLLFLSRHPMKIAMSDQWSRKFYPRTRWARRFAFWYQLGAAILFGMAWAFASPGFWVPLAAGVLPGIVQFWYDVRKDSRALLAEICGAVAIGSVAAGIAMAGGSAWLPACVLWLVLAMQSVSAILYVRTRLRQGRNESVHRWSPIVGHLIGLCLVFGLAYIGYASWAVVGAFTVLLTRAAYGLYSERSKSVRTMMVGIQETCYALLTIVCILAPKLSQTV